MKQKKIQNNITKIYDSYILDIVNEEFPIIRKRTYSSEYFLNHFKNMTNDINNWESLKKLKSYKSKKDSNNESTKDFHYKYNNEIFNLWTSKDVFNRAYNKLLQNHYFKLKHIKKSKVLNLFIDCSYIVNKYGSEHIAPHPEYKKKKGTKLSAICDESKNVLGIIPVNTQLSKSKKSITFPHDIRKMK